MFGARTARCNLTALQSTRLVMGYSFGADPFGLVFSVAAAVVLIAAWVILASSRFVQGGVVERADRVPQLYGYTLCLIGLMWGLVSAISIVEKARRELITDTLSLAIAAALFAFHWRWLRRRAGAPGI
jgi:hypothetical protein